MFGEKPTQASYQQKLIPIEAWWWEHPYLSDVIFLPLAPGNLKSLKESWIVSHIKNLLKNIRLWVWKLSFNWIAILHIQGSPQENGWRRRWWNVGMGGMEWPSQSLDLNPVAVLRICSCHHLTFFKHHRWGVGEAGTPGRCQRLIIGSRRRQCEIILAKAVESLVVKIL